jgi:anti-sigma regulatory factor (Ser/Thr protein kinase)
MDDRASAFPGAPDEAPVARRFPSHPTALHGIREFICDQAVEAAIPTEDAIDLALAVSEVGTISVCQSNSSTIEVTWRADTERIEISLSDDGVFQSEASLRRPDTMGMALVRALVDEFDFRAGTAVAPGNRARLVKFRNGVH